MSTKTVWTKPELLDEARSHGYHLTSRTLTNWIDKGLIANASTEGRGPHEGVGRVWPESQRQLLLKLLNERQHTDSLARLAAWPIAIWIYWGDEHVGTSQAMKAMKTWVKGLGRVPEATASQPVQLLAAQISGPGVPRDLRRRFEELAQGISAYPESFNRETFHNAVKDLLSHSESSLKSNAEGLTRLMEARVRAVLNIDEYTESDFVAARAMILSTRHDYLTLLGVSPLTDPDAQAIASSPVDLATHLGAYQPDVSEGND